VDATSNGKFKKAFNTKREGPVVAGKKKEM
jgi:hypothetical protein